MWRIKGNKQIKKHIQNKISFINENDWIAYEQCAIEVIAPTVSELEKMFKGQIL